MSVSKLNKAATEKSYISFDDLPPGKYPIRKFSVVKKSQFDGEKKLLVHINNGYIVLPTRMDMFTDVKEIEKLNKLKLSFIFNGKETEHGNRLDFSFVGDDSSSSGSSSEDDSEKEDENEGEKVAGLKRKAAKGILKKMNTEAPPKKMQKKQDKKKD